MLPVRKFVKGRTGKWYDGKSYAKTGLKQAIKKRQMMEMIKQPGGLEKFMKFIEGNPRIRPADKEGYIKEAIEMLHLRRGGNVIHAKQLRRKRY